jgi:hypothetical protein
MCEAGRDLEGTDPDEYCDNRLLEACDIGRGILLRREGVEVDNGGKAGWFGFAGGDEPCGGCQTGEDEASVIVAVAVTVAVAVAVAVIPRSGGRAVEMTVVCRWRIPNSTTAWIAALDHTALVRSLGSQSRARGDPAGGAQATLLRVCKRQEER